MSGKSGMPNPADIDPAMLEELKKQMGNLPKGLGKGGLPGIGGLPGLGGGKPKLPGIGGLPFGKKKK